MSHFRTRALVPLLLSVAAFTGLKAQDTKPDLSDPEVESAELVADRVRRAFSYTSPDRITIATDCGMKYLPRASAEGKMRAMAGAASILRAEL